MPDNELVHDDIDDIGPLSLIAQPDEPPRASGRQRAVAQVRPISVSQVVTSQGHRCTSTLSSCARFGPHLHVWSYFWITLFPSDDHNELRCMIQDEQ